MADNDKVKQVAGLRVTARRDGFRRAGRLWAGVTEVPAAEFDKKEIRALRDEPQLVVEDIKLKVPAED